MVDPQTESPGIASLTLNKEWRSSLLVFGERFRVRFPEEHTFFAFLELM